MNDLKIREFQMSITSFINQSDLPMEVKRLCMLDILNQLQTAADSEIRQQIQDRDAAKETKGQSYVENSQTIEATAAESTTGFRKIMGKCNGKEAVNGE